MNKYTGIGSNYVSAEYILYKTIANLKVLQSGIRFYNFMECLTTGLSSEN